MGGKLMHWTNYMQLAVATVSLLLIAKTLFKWYRQRKAIVAEWEATLADRRRRDLEYLAYAEADQVKPYLENN
jgi:hypothetical protein